MKFSCNAKEIELHRGKTINERTMQNKSKNREKKDRQIRGERRRDRYKERYNEN
jgi:hypothetical protein